MKYLIIKDWDKWQSYRKDRGTPPWIKVYRNLMSNVEWVSLSDSEKGQLISMWILAADKCGKIPACPKALLKMCALDKEPDVKKFVELQWFISDDNHMATTCPQHDAPETETETETERGIRTLKGLKQHKLDGKIKDAFSKNFPDVCRFKIRDRVVDYCESKDKKYKDYFATMRSWARKEQEEKTKAKPTGNISYEEQQKKREELNEYC